MPKYLVRASYTTEGVKGLLKDGGSKRVQVVRDIAKSAGATLESMYFALGEDDVYITIDAPDNATLAAISMVTNATGAVKVRTTVLLTPQEMDAATKKSVSYTPPGR